MPTRQNYCDDLKRRLRAGLSRWLIGMLMPVLGAAPAFAYSADASGDWPDGRASTPSSAETDPQGDGTVYLLLHGLNSDESAWNAAVKSLFGNRCPTLREATDPDSIAASRCYRLHFSDDAWPHGDGLSLDQLGDEVSRAVTYIQQVMRPSAIVLVGHSRGGLAARAYLQQSSSTPQFKLALLTIGTPHRGTPLGRVKGFMDQNQVSIGDVPKSVRIRYQGIIPTPVTVRSRDQLEFLFSPSMDFLSTEPGTYAGTPCANRTNQTLCQLNADVGQLSGLVEAFGQMVSRGLVLGGDTPIGEGVELDLLGDLAIKRLFPMLIPALDSGDFVRLRGYVLADIIGGVSRRGDFCSNAKNAKQGGWAWSERNPDSWACNGDGIVPLISQTFSKLLPREKFTTVNLSGVHHTEQTQRTRNIKQLLRAMLKKQAGFQAP
ncbi:esterase/lipase family protein [Methylomagnum sp.]